MPQRPKVFCVGFQKTGTTSLYAALTRLGWRTAAVVGRDLTAAELRARAKDLCLETAGRFDAAEDMPWPLFFRELDQSYPGAKFVLTVRDGESWYQSVLAHFGDAPVEMHKFVYGDDAAAPAGRRETYLRVYERHNADVRDYFKNRPDDLLVMDLAAGDGWPQLSAFLGVAAPDEPFPRRNRRSDRRSLGYRLRRRLHLAFGGYLSPEDAFRD